MVARARIGDVLEMKTAKGLAYAQYTHQNPLMGGLIRILPGLFSKRPQSLAELVEERTKGVVFFPVKAAVKGRVFPVVANLPVPDHSAGFPLFRAAGPPNISGTISWWLWDGEREWEIGKLTNEQRKLPIRVLWTDKMLIQRLESGWGPESAES
jgi:hypothetical protein